MIVQQEVGGVVKRLKTIGSYFLGIVVTLGVFAGAYLFAMDVVTARDSVSWPHTAGTVVSSKVEFFGGGGAGRRSYHTSEYGAVVHYTFTVDGREYTGNRISYASGNNDRLDVAEGKAKMYKPGGAVQVYYKPGNPGECVLEPGPGNVDAIGSFGGVGVCLFIGCFCCLYWYVEIKDRLKARRERAAL